MLPPESYLIRPSSFLLKRLISQASSSLKFYPSSILLLIVLNFTLPYISLDFDDFEIFIGNSCSKSSEMSFWRVYWNSGFRE